jgi:protein-disulfide isomerase
MIETSASGHPHPEEVMAWIDGEGAAGDVARHLASCTHCQALAGDVRDVSAQLATWTVEPAAFQIPSRRALPEHQWRYIGMAALLVIGFLAWSSVHEWRGGTTPARSGVAQPIQADRAAFERDWAVRPRVDVGAPADGAAVVVVVFLDWQCPACKAADLAYKPILEKYERRMPGAIKYVTKDYPLNNRCNADVPGQMHPGACEAAAAVRLATERGKTGAMIDWLFAHQEELTPESVQAQARTLLGVSDFAAEYARVLPDVKRDAAQGEALRVGFTPTYYINGVKAQLPGGGWFGVEQFELAIQYELKRAGR